MDSTSLLNPVTGTESNKAPLLGSSESTVTVDTENTSLYTDNTRRASAAETIQRNYRGYRTRRALNGYSLDPSTRWIETVRQAQYANSIRPRPRREYSDAPSLASLASTDTSQSTVSFAQSEWRRLRYIARQAHNDDSSDTEGEKDMSEQQLADYRKQRSAEKSEREKNAKLMGLEYFLELVDEKHRYGSHLRAYHAIWKQEDTHDNFFYWLDQGPGRYKDAPTCSREKLDRDQVRYLTREERQSYLVKVDKDGRLRWAKNEEHVNTNIRYKDSLRGIVSYDDPTPAYREDTRYAGNPSSTADPPLSSSDSDLSDPEHKHYANEDLHAAKGVEKVKYVSAAALLNHLLQSTTKQNTWIFVADTSFRLFIGIKQSGAFQHSSFLHGARISAAGIIKVKDGQLRSLSPLSGHYRPPTKNFRAFVHALKARGVDMTRVSISRSYAVLLGIEGYMKTKARTKSGMQELERQMERVLHPEEAKKRAEAERDRSASAQKEREWLAKQRDERRAQRWTSGLRRKLTEPGGGGGGAAAATKASSENNVPNS